MDIELEKRINDTIEYLKQISLDSVEEQFTDPIAKIMLVSLLYECQKIWDYVDGVSEKIAEKFCEDFIPRKQVEAMPSIAVIKAQFKAKKDCEEVPLSSNISFNYKIDSKTQLSFLPIFKNLLIPDSDIYLLTDRLLRRGSDTYEIAMESPNTLWVGIDTCAEIENLKGMSMLLNGTGGIRPEHIYVGPGSREIEFVDMSRLEDIDMLEPFDSQQATGKMFSFIESWKEQLLDMEDASLIYITDPLTDRDTFKTCNYPRSFQKWLEDEVLGVFPDSILWMRLDFAKGYTVPDNCTVEINAIPVTNIDVNTLTLTQSAPIAKLQKKENSFFLQVVETSNTSYKQGFNMSSDEIIIRDFDASCYNDGNLYRDVRNLYNRFIDDYYAFIEYNGIKDGETIRVLRETINKIGKSVGTQNARYKFDSGTYAMKNMSIYPPTTSTKVSYLTTMGKLGNMPQIGDTVENKKLPVLEKELKFLLPAMGGTDKSTADEKYELLRYYSMTNDRLYTQKDIDAFLRKELISEFGKTEFQRIFINMHIGGHPGKKQLTRGLYIDIEFKDRKNYEHALGYMLDKKLHKKIMNRSCISMPVIIDLINLEE